MSSTRIYQNILKKPVISTLVLIFGNYELYRIHKGTHPYWTPRLEAAGIIRPQDKEDLSQEQVVQKASGAADESTSTGTIRWLNVNGLPVPTLGSLMRPFGKD
ncbi:hypothetical protein ACN47E_009822 [Coniothyrium glycines]